MVSIPLRELDGFGRSRVQSRHGHQCGVSIPLRELDGFGLSTADDWDLSDMEGFNTLAGIRWIWSLMLQSMRQSETNTSFNTLAGIRWIWT